MVNHLILSAKNLRDLEIIKILNPFNPYTTIVYKINKPEFISLIVYDILGIEVATLVSEEKPAGSYEIEFDASGFSSGIYFYELRTGSFIDTKKMILLK